jgi:hypothetical protein
VFDPRTVQPQPVAQPTEVSQYVKETPESKHHAHYITYQNPLSDSKDISSDILCGEVEGIAYTRWKSVKQSKNFLDCFIETSVTGYQPVRGKAIPLQALTGP